MTLKKTLELERVRVELKNYSNVAWSVRNNLSRTIASGGAGEKHSASMMH